MRPISWNAWMSICAGRERPPTSWPTSTTTPAATAPWSSTATAWPRPTITTIRPSAWPIWRPRAIAMVICRTCTMPMIRPATSPAFVTMLSRSSFSIMPSWNPTPATLTMPSTNWLKPPAASIWVKRGRQPLPPGTTKRERCLTSRTPTTPRPCAVTGNSTNTTRWATFCGWSTRPTTVVGTGPIIMKNQACWNPCGKTTA